MSQNTALASFPRGSKRRGQGAAAFAAFIFAALSWAAMLVPHWPISGRLLLVGIPTLLAMVTWRRSRLISCHLLLMSASFGVAPWILNVPLSDLLLSVVLAWSCAITAGVALAFSLRTTELRDHKPSANPTWLHAIVALLLIAIQARLILAGTLGYGAQLNLGRSTPTGVMGIASTAGPVFTLAFLFSTLARRSKLQPIGIALTMIQVGLLAASGFRGAPLVFLLASFAGSAVTLPTDSPWRRPASVAIAAVSALAFASVAFVAAAAIKSDAADAARLSSEGTQRVSADTVARTLATRLDLASALEVGLSQRNDQAALNAVAVSSQAMAIIPRFLWPKKPDVDYGVRVAAVFFGETSGKSNSTITMIGDSLLNFGSTMPLAGILFGALVGGAESRLQGGVGHGALVCVAVLSTTVMTLEIPLVIKTIGILRDFLVVFAIWIVCDWVVRRVGRADPSTPTIRDCH